MKINDKDFGPMIQDYVRAKWGRGDMTVTADELGRKLDPALRERVDLLGVDDEKLLGVRPEEVIRRIESLEREALREDSGVNPHKMAFAAASGALSRPAKRQSNRDSNQRRAYRSGR
jgi:hypothetical protein